MKTMKLMLLLSLCGPGLQAYAQQPAQDSDPEANAENLERVQRGGKISPRQKAELAKAVTDKTLRLSGTWETMGHVAGSMAEIVRFGLPDDYYQTYAARIRALGLPDLGKAATIVIHPGQLIWVVVGDRAKIEAGLKELGLGEIRLLDFDGNPVKR